MNDKNTHAAEHDYTQAALYYMEEADKGCAKAQTSLGVCYSTGKGAEQDVEKAAYWLKKAARQSHVEAMFILAMLYEENSGAQNLREGLLWLILAAKQGDAEAKKLLSEMPHIDYSLVDMQADGLIALAEQDEIKSLSEYGLRFKNTDNPVMGCARLKLIRQPEIPVYSHLRSNFGGYPYFEKGEEWPVSKDGTSMDFVFQLFSTDKIRFPMDVKLIQFFYDFDKNPWSAKDDGWFIKVYEHINLDNTVDLPWEWRTSYCDYYYDVEYEAISQRDKIVFQSQVGGRPRWLQGDDSPGDNYHFLFQLDSTAGLHWGDMGLVYGFYNPSSKKTWFELQCT
jgi:uncharacterized protein YwqG